MGDDVVDDHDEGSCRTSYLHGVAAKGRHEEASYDGRDKTDGGAHARCDAEGDGKGQRHDAYYDAGCDVGAETLHCVVPERSEKLWMKVNCTGEIHCMETCE